MNRTHEPPSVDSLSAAQLADLYRTMRLIRRFEETVNDLYMQGRIPSTLHLYIGQEAVATGVCANLRADDFMFSTHRPHGHAIAKGVAPRDIMAELFAKVTGTCKGKGGSMHVGDMRVNAVPAIAIVGGNVPIAAGTALAAKLQGGAHPSADGLRVTACFFGDGAANEGAWHEGLNAAAIWDLPVVYVCENNLYAASTPFKTAFKVERIADRAAAYGMPGVSVDGNDVLAVYAATREAVLRARRGQGPTLIECLTYRLCGHSRSDPRTYRAREEEAEWGLRDPIPVFRARLLAEGQAAEEQLARIEADVEQVIREATDYAEASPAPQPQDVYTDIFA
jgi:TPP-dependent pyruvate/acetoin dehydrogenase alpha subunit